MVKVLGAGCVTDLRLSLDENMRPRGFGYIELKDESMVDRAIDELSGLDIGEISEKQSCVCVRSVFLLHLW